MIGDTPEEARLLELLAEALAPPAAQPTRAERAALRRAVSDVFGRRPSRLRRSVTAVFGPFPILSGRLGALIRRRALPAILVACLLGGTAAAAVARPALPEPIRSAAHAVGLPVDSVALAETKRAMSEVRSALHHRDDRALRQAAASLAVHLSRLHGQDLEAVTPEAQQLLRLAYATLAGSEPVGVHGPAPLQRPGPSATGLQPSPTGSMPAGTSPLPATTMAPGPTGGGGAMTQPTTGSIPTTMGSTPTTMTPTSTTMGQTSITTMPSSPPASMGRVPPRR